MDTLACYSKKNVAKCDNSFEMRITWLFETLNANCTPRFVGGFVFSSALYKQSSEGYSSEGALSCRGRTIVTLLSASSSKYLVPNFNIVVGRTILMQTGKSRNYGGVFSVSLGVILQQLWSFFTDASWWFLARGGDEQLSSWFRSVSGPCGVGSISAIDERRCSVKRWTGRVRIETTILVVVGKTATTLYYRASNKARLPAEFKHINKRRKRN